jgi:RNA polymerase sigma factor (sigma-70 family)
MPGSSFGEVLRLIRSALDGSGIGGLSDAQLLERFFAQRDERAFGVLVERHGSMVLSVCRRIMGDAHQSEDAFQAAFLVLIRKTTSLTGKQSVGGWLHGVARRVALRARAQSALRRQKEREATVMSSTGPLDELTLQELRSVLDEEIASLSEKYQGPIVLCHLEGKTYDEAARELGCTKVTLSRRLTKARALLRRKLERRGITLSLATLATALTEAAQAAPLPAFLALNTVKAATLVATGKTAAGGCLSASALALAEEALTGMLLAKGKLVVMVMAVGLAIGGAGWAGYKGLAETGGPGIKALAAGQKKQAEVQEREEPTVAKDQFGDPLPAEAIARMGTTRFWYSNPGKSYYGNHVLYSPDGRKMIVNTDEEVFILDSTSGRLLHRIRPAGDTIITSISVSSDGKSLALGTDNEGRAKLNGLQVFDLNSGKFVRDFKEERQETYLGVRFSPHGTTLASHLFHGKAIVLWDFASGRELHRIATASMGATFIFSPDGKIIVIGDGKTIRLLDVGTGNERRRIDGHPGMFVDRLAFSPDGKTLASHSATEEKADIHDHPEVENKIYFWDCATGEKSRQIQLIRDDVKARKKDQRPFLMRVQFEFSLNGKQFVTNNDEYLIPDYSKSPLRSWDLETGKELRCFETNPPILNFCYSPDGSTMAFLDDAQFVRFWNPATGQEVREHSGHRHVFTDSALAISPDGKTLATGILDEWDARLWNLGTGQQQNRIRFDDANLDFHFSSDGRSLIALGTDKKLTYWDTVSGAQQKRLLTPLEGSHGFHVLSQDRRMFVSPERKNGFETKIFAWDTVTGTKINQIVCFNKLVAMGISTDNRYVYGWDQEKVLVWNLATGKLIRDFAAGVKSFGAGIFSADGKWFLYGLGGHPYLLYDLDKGQQARRFETTEFKEDISCFVFSPNGRYVALGHFDGTIDLLEFASGKLRHQLIGGHQAAIQKLLFTPDSHRLVSASADTTALVWDLTGNLKAKPSELAPADIVACWNDLKSDDAARAYQAIRRFAAVPGQTIPFFDKNLLPIASPESKTITAGIADLESAVFAKRDAAMKELTKLGELAGPALSQALGNAPTLEARNRIKQLLDRLPNIGTTGEPLRQARAVEALENIGNPQARQLLEKLAAGARQANLTRDAIATLERLKRR